MKTTILTILILISLSASAQKIKIQNGYVEIEIDSNQSVMSAFDKLGKMLPHNMKWFDRYVVKQGIKYYQPGIRVLRRVYRIEKGNCIPVRF